jgi:hypothetical protein
MKHDGFCRRSIKILTNNQKMRLNAGFDVRQKPVINFSGLDFNRNKIVFTDFDRREIATTAKSQKKNKTPGALRPPGGY